MSENERVDDVETVENVTPKAAEPTEASGVKADSAEFERLCGLVENIETGKRQMRAFNQAKQAQDKWNTLAKKNPKSARNLEKRFKKACDTFFQVHREYLERDEWERWANYQKKKELVSSVTAMGSEEDQATIARTVQNAQSKWKKVGPVPHKESDAIWEEFRKVCDEQFARCGDYLAQKEGQRDEQIKLKEQLCVDAEKLSESSEWKSTAAKLRNLQKKWKDMGPMPRKFDKNLYKRFKKACDKFFASRSSHLKDMDAKREGNMNDKLALIAEVKEVSENEALSSLESKLQTFEARFKQAGPVPREKDDEIWNAWREATGTLYAKLDENRKGNLVDKENMLTQVQEMIDAVDDKTDIDRLKFQLKGMQKRWTALPPGPRKEDRALGDKFFSLVNDFVKNAKNADQRRAEEEMAAAAKRQALIEQVEDLPFSASADEVSEKLKAIQADFKAVTVVKGARDEALRKEFQAAVARVESSDESCDDASKAANLKKAEGLVVRMEMLGSGQSQSSTLSLADRFRLALEAPSSGRRKSDGVDTQTEVRQIKSDFLKVGAIPAEQKESIWQRMRAALESVDTK